MPGVVIATEAATGTLAADPIAAMLNRFGLLALVFLIASLACTPLNVLFRWAWPARIRRMLGLFAFGYATAHVSTYVGIDQTFDFAAIVEDFAKRPFILVGFLAFVSLVPLALTSTNESVKRLGYRKWKRLHRLAYAAGIFASIHFILRVKKDLTEPLIYTAILAALFLVRGLVSVRKRLKTAAVASSKP